MTGKFLLGSNGSFAQGNIYADKSSLILNWLLREGLDKKSFSLREVSEASGVSTGLTQKVFATLALYGLLQIHGVRTAKRFSIKNPEILLKNWLKHYNIVKKCKMRTYRSRFANREDLLSALELAGLQDRVALALHSAAKAHGCKNTTLTTLELYLLEPSIRGKLEQALELEPQERGYEVLLIEPYYKSCLRESPGLSPPLLTFLDLYHFPLRGLEQAESMAERLRELKRIYRKE